MKRIILLLLPVLALIYWYIFARFVPAPPLVISRETTYFTDLTEKDGRYSLAASMNKMLRLPPEENAAIELLQIYGADVAATDSAELAEFCQLLEIEPSFLATPTLVSQLPALISASGLTAEPFVLNLAEGQQEVFRKPWKQKDFPEIASLVEANAGTFALIEKMAGKNGFYWPYLDRYDIWQTPMSREIRPNQLFRLLLARGMNRLANDDVRGAWQDFVCSGMAARPLLQSDQLIYGLFGVIGMNNAYDAMLQVLNDQSLDENFLSQILADIDRMAIKSGFDQAIENNLRFFYLSLVLESNQSLWQKTGLAYSDSAKDGEDYSRYVDRNVYCRNANRYADELMQIWKTENVKERIKLLDDWEDKLDARRKEKSALTVMIKLLWAKYLTPASSKCSAVTEVIGDILTDIAMPRHNSALKEMLSTTEKFRLLKVAALIKLHKAKTGEYPASLEKLAVADQQMLVDSFSGERFHYGQATDTVTIYSIGANLQDDSGRSDKTAETGDLVVKIIKH